MGRQEFLNSLKVKKNSERYTSKKLDFDKLQKNVRKLIVMGALSVSVLGFTGCASKEVKEPVVPTTVGPVVDNTKESSEYENLDSYAAVLQDFKERYVKEYNEVNGTNISAEDIKVNLSYTDYLYEINGKYVTHGATPYETQKVLQQVGSYDTVSGDIKIYQIIDKSSGKALESYAKGSLDNRNYLSSPVLSGNNLNSLQKELNQNTNSILSNYYEGIDIVSNIQSSDKYNIDNYIEFIEILDNREVEQEDLER